MLEIVLPGYLRQHLIRKFLAEPHLKYDSYKDTLFNRVPNHMDTHNDNQYLTRLWTQLHLCLNNFNVSCRWRLPMSYTAPAGRREVGIA
jgi:hypothetical protein